MKIRLVATLPKISIQGEEIQLHDARLIKLPFDKILEFEKQQKSADYDQQRFKYTNHPPVFFEKYITVPDDIYSPDNNVFIRKLKEITEPYITNYVLSLYFYTGVPILSPYLSAVYFDARDDSNFRENPELRKKIKEIGVYPLYGESGKEYLFHNESPSIIIVEKGQNEFSRFYSFITSKSKVIQSLELQNVFEALHALSLPGINQHIRLVLIIGALEAFLIPDKKKQINQHFKKRFYSLCNRNGEQDKVWMNQAYNMRSELIHGRDGIDKQLKKTQYDLHTFLKLLLQATIVGLSKFLEYADGNSDIKRQLEEFRDLLSLEEGDGLLRELLNSCDYERKTKLTHRWLMKKA